MSCHCAKNRKRLALLVDHDSAGKVPEDIRRILANCPTCREHYEHLCAAMDSLQQAGEKEAVFLEKSLWSELAHRLPDSQPRPSRYSLWRQQIVPIFSVTAACLALLLVFVAERPAEKRIYRTAINRSTSSLPLPSISVDYTYAPFRDSADSRSQQAPLSIQSLHQTQEDLFLRETSPGLTQDFPDPLESQVREILRQRRLFEMLE